MENAAANSASVRTVLNVGGGSKKFLIPQYYSTWRHDLLDIDPKCRPDILLDARELQTLAPNSYDAVYCAHNLEHYHRHEGLKVLKGFLHVLKPDGFVEVHVPDMEAVFTEIAQRKLDIDDVLYTSPIGPLLVRDVIYGYHVEIEEKNNEYYAHKTGFTRKSLPKFFSQAGFAGGAIGIQGKYDLTGYFFKQPPTADQMKFLGIVTA